MFDASNLWLHKSGLACKPDPAGWAGLTPCCWNGNMHGDTVGGRTSPTAASRSRLTFFFWGIRRTLRPRSDIDIRNSRWDIFAAAANFSLSVEAPTNLLPRKRRRGEFQHVEAARATQRGDRLPRSTRIHLQSTLSSPTWLPDTRTVLRPRKFRRQARPRLAVQEMGE